jgi:ribosome-associated toxin RatA of RatAB toxin-antitoxin module
VADSLPIMAVLRGERTVDVDAPVARCFEIAADLGSAPEWQPALRSVEVLQADGAGRPARVRASFDAKVRNLEELLRFAYEEPGAITFDQERGDVRSLRGWWRFEDLSAGRTRATYGLEVEPSRMLGMLLRGPAEASVREHLLRAADALKVRAESGG